VANPERIRNVSDFASIFLIVQTEPARTVISQENKITIMVLSAVATSESVFLIPHFARTDVSPAKKADNTAAVNHMASSSPIHICAELISRLN